MKTTNQTSAVTKPEVYAHPQGGWCVKYPVDSKGVCHFTHSVARKSDAKEALGRMTLTDGDIRHWEGVEK